MASGDISSSAANCSGKFRRVRQDESWKAVAEAISLGIAPFSSSFHRRCPAVRRLSRRKHCSPFDIESLCLRCQPPPLLLQLCTMASTIRNMLSPANSLFVVWLECQVAG